LRVKTNDTPCSAPPFLIAEDTHSTTKPTFLVVIVYLFFIFNILNACVDNKQYCAVIKCKGGVSSKDLHPLSMLQPANPHLDS